ncbi:uncharacterized protein LOC134855584 [Symsagittifera roscoffensis]|uniref:uncharacterized protein LOC134855584 n=1 Tax=Symsagittifera roscoffensis TaxID=84072 RepID=UPI00307C253E
MCRELSQFYCLNGYGDASIHTSQLHNDIAASVSLDYEEQANVLIRAELEARFEGYIQHVWRRINFFDDEQQEARCCDRQVDKYIIFGQERLHLTPTEYFEKLTDYHNEMNKPLNYISAMWNPRSCINIITEVGFGPGGLQPFAGSVNPGFKFAFPPLPEVQPRAFSYRRITSQLNFHWFKHQIMCRDQPWICAAGTEGSGDTSGQFEPKSSDELDELNESRTNDKNELRKHRRLLYSYEFGSTTRRHHYKNSHCRR